MIAKLKTESVAYNELGVQVEGASTYLCDSADDLEQLNKMSCQVGSKALVIDDSESSSAVYIKSPSGEFKKFKGQSLIN